MGTFINTKNMKNNQKGGLDIVIALVMCVALLGFFGYNIHKNLSKQSNTSQLPVPTASTELTEKVAEEEEKVATPDTADKQSAPEPVATLPTFPDCTLATGPIVGDINFDSYGLGLSKPATSFQTYEIYGNNKYEAAQQRRDCGPDGFGAKAVWKLGWTYFTQEEDGICRSDRGKVVVQSGIQMPDWVFTEATSDDDKQLWNTFIANLTQHEKNHISNGWSAGNDVHSLMTSYSQNGCSGFSDTLNAQLQQIVDSYEAVDEAYDAETNHGSTEGAVFP